MSISSRLEAINQHLLDDYSILTLAGADLTNVDKNIFNLKETWKERLLYFLANGTDVVWNNWLPKVNGTGETITLNNTIEAKMDFVYKGNTSQKTTTGKNLFNSIYYKNQEIYTETISISTGDLYCAKLYLKPNTTYTISEALNNWTLTGAWIFVIADTNNQIIRYLQNRPQDYQTNPTTFTTNSEGYVYIGHRYGFTVGATDRMLAFLDTVNIQIEEGNTATSFEEYTNGASPNPDYPQNIQVVSGDNTIKVEGKNLLPITNQDLTINGVSFKAQNGKIIINGTATSNISGANLKNDNSFPITLKAGTYYFKRTSNDISTGLIDDNNNTIVSLPSSADTYEQSFTLSSDKKLYLFFFIASGRTITNYEYELMISNTATPYEPYQSQTYPINLGDIELCKIGDYQDKIAKSTGKNLFDKSAIEEGKRLGGDGLPFVDTSFDLSNYIKVDSNTQYTYSRGSNGSGSSAIAYYDSSKTFISRTMPIMDSNAREIVLTTPNNATYVRIADLKTTLDSMQFEKGSSSSSYEPYGKVWYLNKQIGKAVLNGSETSWETFENASTGNTRLFGVNDYDNIPREAYIGLSNYFTNSSSTIWSVDYEAMTVNNTGTSQIRFRINKTIADSIEAFTTWLSTHNTTVYYVLATPTTTEITDTTLISQLEAIKKSYNNQTNISQENSKEAFILDVTALGN